MRVLLLAASLFLFLAPQPSPAPTPVAVAIKARAIQPGEVVRLDISSPRPIAGLQVRAFDREVPVVPAGADQWRALVGIDLDVAPGDHVVAIDTTFEDGAKVVHEQTLAVEGKAFPTRQLRVAPRFVNPPASVQARIERERRRLGALFRATAPAARWEGPFRRPIEVGVISGFGVRSVFNGEPRAPHGGADFASPAGTPVLAPAGGRVVMAEPLYFTGRTVVLDHGVGLISLFAHLSRIDVKVGGDVRAGSRLGLVGATGRVTGPHLHWTVRLQGARVDPMSLIAALEDRN